MRLFWKIFLTLVVALSLTAALGGWLSQHWLRQQQGIERLADALKHQGEAGAELYAVEGRRPYKRWLLQSMRRHRFIGFLLDEQGRHVLNQPLPPELRPLLKRLQQDNSAFSLMRPPRIIWAGPLQAGGQNWYWIASARLSPRLMQQNRNFQVLIYLLSALLLVLSASLLISRMISRPIRQLRHTSRRIGKGELHARPPEKMQQRRDEIGELACDFDTMAEQLSSLVTSHKELLRNISHELRSPLARLQVALELARNHDARNTSELDRIDLEAGRMNELIGEVLTLARFDQGAMQLQQEPVDLHALLQQLCDELTLEADARPCRLRLHADSPVPVTADRRWLRRAVENIIRNAIRHTAAGSDVIIRLERNDHRTTISIRDHGTGVEPDKIRHLFEPFYRTSEGRERDSGGYGLGLAIARQVIGAHGGHIHAANHPEGGLMMTITWPAASTNSR